MLDAKSLLGTLLQAGTSKATSRRVGHALREPGLADTLGGLLGGGRGGVGGGGLAGLAESVLGKGGAVGGLANNKLAMGGIGALAGAVLGGRGTMRGAIGGGALALIGSIALNAIQSRMAAGGDRIATAEDVPVALREPASAAEEASQQSQALILLEAMISAAKADGQIDGAEMQRIMGKLDEAGADQEAKDFVLYQMRQPVDLQRLIGQVGSEEMAAEVYAASLLAIEVDTDAERTYLDRLATGLGIDQALRQRIHAALGVAV